ncbi:hypothetical protein BDW68DRAFT_160018 [Aspergillus falconensis]
MPMDPPAWLSDMVRQCAQLSRYQRICLLLAGPAAGSSAAPNPQQIWASNQASNQSIQSHPQSFHGRAYVNKQRLPTLNAGSALHPQRGI